MNLPEDECILMYMIWPLAFIVEARHDPNDYDDISSPIHHFQALGLEPYLLHSSLIYKTHILVSLNNTDFSIG